MAAAGSRAPGAPPARTRVSPARTEPSAGRPFQRFRSSTLTPDPLYVRFYYSHPPASERLAALPHPQPLPA